MNYRTHFYSSINEAECQICHGLIEIPEMPSKSVSFIHNSGVLNTYLIFEEFSVTTYSCTIFRTAGPGARIFGLFFFGLFV